MSERWLWTQKEDIGPSPRYGHAMAYEAARQRVVLVGGGSGGSSALLNDTWGWDGVAWSQVADMGPPPRSSHTIVFDSSRECLVLFGGGWQAVGQSGIWLSDTWEWNEDAGWVKRQDIGPRSMANPRMAQTEAHTVLFGFTGVTSGAGQTWEWNDNLWTQRQNMGPPRRTAYNIAYDSQRDRVVLFGGWGVGGLALGDTWELAIIEQ